MKSNHNSIQKKNQLNPCPKQSETAAKLQQTSKHACYPNQPKHDPKLHCLANEAAPKLFRLSEGLMSYTKMTKHRMKLKGYRHPIQPIAATVW